MTAKYLFIASMDVDPEHEHVFNDLYDHEHIPSLLRVPGVNSVVRYESQELEMSLGGAVQRIPASGPRYHAIYEIDGPEALVSREWAEAVERGRWPTEVRPFTANRRHLLIKRRAAGAD
jgi:hypothetical protein